MYMYTACVCVCMYVIFCLVTCPSLTEPNNGTITCSLGDDGVPSFEDTCSFTCNTGYELTGSDTRTCQSNMSWSGSETMCIRGMHCLWYIIGSFNLIYIQFPVHY